MQESGTAIRSEVAAAEADGRRGWTVRGMGRGLVLLSVMLVMMGDGGVRAVWARMRGGRFTAPAGTVWMHRWCRRLARWLRLRIEVDGEPQARGAIVCNHQSYLEILLLMAVRPMVIVAKQEVRGWPLLGRLTAWAGTVYVVRGGGPASWPGVNRAMTEAYATGLPVMFFPEGTTTDGREVLPFRRGLFHSVLDGGQPLQVAALGYDLGRDTCTAAEAEVLANDVCWWGDAVFAPHLLRFLRIEDVRLRVRFGEVVEARRDRWELSETAQARVAAMAAELRARCDEEVVAATVDETFAA